MRFFIASDFHADASTNGLDRFDEIRKAAFSVADAAIAAQKKSRRSEVSFVFTGDLCDPDTTRSFRAISLAIELARYLDNGGVNSIWIAGNHDVIEDSQGSTVLAPLFAAAPWSHRVMVVQKPFLFCTDRLTMVFLPYVARANAYDPEQYVATCLDQIPDKCRGYDAIVFGHLTVPSAERGSESDDFARGRDMIFPVEECRKRWGDRCILVNGHYHRKQITKDGVHIPGSLARLRHDEEQHEPGYLVIEV
jgi:DNA repair exonuclease SbcCD nuclease subunit